MRQFETYECELCGAIVEVQNVGGGTLECCNEEMTLKTKSLTQVNLMKAFAGESQARNKYDYFAGVAKKEGHNDIARHFEKAAYNEHHHAKLELKAYNKLTIDKELEGTIENLKSAIGGENFEHTSMYPDFAKIAKEEGHNKIAKMFELIGAVEVEHEKMYQKLLNRLQEGKEFESDTDETWLCEKCGHIHTGKKAPKACPVCAHEQAYFARA